MKNQRLKILIVAHEFSPEQGSECAEGWNLVTRIAKFHDVTVIYASSDQFGNNSYVDAVKNYLQVSSPIPGLTFVNIDQPRLTKFLAGINNMYEILSPIGFPLFYFVGYKYWQKAAFRVAKRLHNINHFDIVHQLTQITFREPGYLWKLGVPFVWGPTGGTSILPKQFRKQLPFRTRMMERFRSFSNYYQFNFTNRIIWANKKAALIYAYSNEDAVRKVNFILPSLPISKFPISMISLLALIVYFNPFKYLSTNVQFSGIKVSMLRFCTYCFPEFL